MLNHSTNNNGSKRSASKGASVGIIVYLFLASFKLIASYYFHSAALKADGLNNLSDIISSLTLFIGLLIAKRPADHDHHFGHSKYEPLASFVTSLIMFTIGFEVLKEGIHRFITHQFLQPNLQSVWVALISILILFIAYRYMDQLAKETGSLGLKASAKDLFSDMLTTVGTSIAILGSSLGFPQIDTFMSLIVACLIIKTAYDIFSESTFTLSDGFDEEALRAYKDLILKHPRVEAIPSIRGRLCGSYIYVDITVEIDRHLSVVESHHITQEIEQILCYHYGVRDVDVHVEPYYESNE
ncbi:cation diffusion facilitator family transporter [Vaginisenegalia massiliensis]|uniref:cation diffusion facilitator family transporter n=1 Tax=Vaginisenegalia massiliensis TaxID=2058294 RepID=UPI000F537960|nr:cation diffusion facilitator family transporter [Vaginisenegalia massiliensis]